MMECCESKNIIKEKACHQHHGDRRTCLPTDVINTMVIVGLASRRMSPTPW